jgi:hypothetical protein
MSLRKFLYRLLVLPVLLAPLVTTAAPTYNVTNLGTISGYNSQASGINDAGEVVGGAWVRLLLLPMHSCTPAAP